MTVNIGDSITAASFNTLADRIDDWFGDGCAACAFGDPDQRFGWGGSLVSDKGVGNDILATDFNEMIDRANIGIRVVNFPAGFISQVSIGNSIRASEYNDIDAKEVSIRAVKNVIDMGETSIFLGATSTRIPSWISNIDCVAKYDFASFNKARYFFNSGGAVQISLVLTGGTTGNAASWATLFATMGTITMDLDGTAQSGSGGAPSGIGFYQLTTGYQLIFTQSGTGVYADNEIEIYASRSITSDDVHIYVLLRDDHAGTVDGTTVATFRYRKLDDQSSGAESLVITAPVTTIVNAL